MSRRFLLYGHSGSYNHGAEAIAKCTVDIVRRKHPGAHIVLSSHFPEQDMMFGIAADKFCGPAAQFWEMEKVAPPGEKKALAEKMYGAALAEITGSAVLISIGGDNFCYGNWHRLAVFQERAKSSGSKSILWGASLDKNLITPEMLNTLRTYDAIIAREAVTYDILKRHGFGNVMKAPDVAFGLEAEETRVDSRNYVAINAGPLIVRKNPLVLPAIQKVADYVASHTDMDILLLPHVASAADNDCDVLRQVKIPDTGRLSIAAENLSAKQYKHIISRARLGIFARTHASIAAYSSCVPTLAVGYSSKAKGIAEDLGMGEYLVDSGEMTREGDILEKFTKLLENESEVRNSLASRMSLYKNFDNYYAAI